MNLQDAADRFTSAFAKNLVTTVVAVITLVIVVKVIAPSGDAKASITVPGNDCGDGAAAMICADATLKSLREQTNTAIADAAALYRRNNAARKELKAMVPQLIAMRNYAAAEGGVGLSALMRGQLDFLQALDKPRNNYEGRWISPMGEITISETPRGFSADFESKEPTSKAWTCSARSNATIKDGSLLFAEGDHSSSESSLKGWTIRMKRDGAVMWISEIPPAGANANATAPYCDTGGGLRGAYFPAK